MNPPSSDDAREPLTVEEADRRHRQALAAAAESAIHHARLVEAARHEQIEARRRLRGEAE